MNPYYLLEHLYIGIIYLSYHNIMKRHSKYCRGNMDMSNKSLVKSRCKLCAAFILFLIGIYFSITWINWDAAVVFNKPSENDIYVKTTEVDDVTLVSKRWGEKKSFVREVFIESCQNGYDVLTNLNIKILGTRVTNSLVYLCKDDKMYVNLRLNPKKTKTRLICNETYGDLWKLENKRYHPLEYSYVLDGDITRSTHNTTNYEETCMLYQASELLKGNWKPKSIKDHL